MRDRLVIVRGGDQSLHPIWLNHGSRSFDVLLSYFGDQDTPLRGAYDRLHRCKGTKWQGLADLFARESDLLERYAQVWIPDDDLFTDGRNIDALFAAAAHHGFDLCQPALTPYSYVTHPITLQRNDCIARVTDFVEVMAPLFSQRALRELAPTFGENPSGWGLEWLWKQRCTERGFRQGIIDAHPVFHTRPVGAVGHGGANSPRTEMDALLQRHGLVKTRPKILERIPAEIPRWRGALRARLMRELFKPRKP